jgi:hypothetical protein
MKVITIRQPWATLIALGEKKFETRSWQTKYRGPLAIHASKKGDFEAFFRPEIKEALEKHGIEYFEDLTTGAIIAIGELVDCYRIEEKETTGARLSNGEYVCDEEFMFGDYGVGRFAWKLEDAIELTKPVPAKGKLSLWEYEGDLFETSKSTNTNA